MIDQINAMLNSMTNAPEIVRPIRGWIIECKKNVNQTIRFAIHIVYLIRPSKDSPSKGMSA
jgi:hypothetical protein